MGGTATRNRCSEGIGEGREQHAPRALCLLFICSSMRLYKPTSGCALGVWAVACACVCVGVYVRACAGRASKRCCVKRVWGKQTLSSPGTLGVCVCVCVRVRVFAHVSLRLRACVFSLCNSCFVCFYLCFNSLLHASCSLVPAPAGVSTYVCGCSHGCVCARMCIGVRPYVRVRLHLYKPPRGAPRCMQRADHHRLFQST
jgi:hypothetical protein